MATDWWMVNSSETDFLKFDTQNYFSDELIENSVFIITGPIHALMVSIIVKNKPFRCIYEDKQITWRKINFPLLFDTIIGEKNFISKEIISVPYPYNFEDQNVNVLSRYIWQHKFKKKISKNYKLDDRFFYVGNEDSPLILANKERINFCLLDEGLGSFFRRNALHVNKNGFFGFMKRTLPSLAPFSFKNKIKKITLANDFHPSVSHRIDFTEYYSNVFFSKLEELNRVSQNIGENVLVQLMTPPFINPNANDRQIMSINDFIDFNVKEITRFINKFKLTRKAKLFLKAHPSFKNQKELISPVIEKLNDCSIISYSTNDLIDFEYASSIPSEAILAYKNFDYLLSLDATSTIFNVAHKRKCFFPFRKTLDFIKRKNYRQIFYIYEKMDAINQAYGNHVKFY